MQGVGLGRALVVDALRRIASASEVIGVRAVLIHCESESARAFYLRLAGFEASPTDPMHLLLLMKDLRRSLSPDPQVDDLVQAGIVTPAANPGGVTALLAVRPFEGGGDTTRALAGLREDRV